MTHHEHQSSQILMPTFRRGDLAGVSSTFSVLIYHVFLLHSSFVLDQFKRVYSNEDTATKAIPFFWENFDKEGWSIWHADYKYSDELKFIFMSSNLVGGMFQRLDKLRKYAFASVVILGKDHDNIIQGVWIMRGQKLAFDVSEPLAGV